jgi:TolA-binding protein
MSIKRLNDDERATYFLGLAVRRQMEEARDNFAATGKSDPKSKKAFDSIFR